MRVSVPPTQHSLQGKYLRYIIPLKANRHTAVTALASRLHSFSLLARFPCSCTWQLSVGFMIGGALIAAFYDLKFELRGYLLILGNDFFTAAYGICIKRALNLQIPQMRLVVAPANSVPAHSRNVCSVTIHYLYVAGEQGVLKNWRNTSDRVHGCRSLSRSRRKGCSGRLKSPERQHFSFLTEVF